MYGGSSPHNMFGYLIISEKAQYALKSNYLIWEYVDKYTNVYVSKIAK